MIAETAENLGDQFDCQLATSIHDCHFERAKRVEIIDEVAEANAEESATPD